MRFVVLLNDWLFTIFRRELIFRPSHEMIIDDLHFTGRLLWLTLIDRVRLVQMDSVLSSRAPALNFSRSP